MKSKESENKIRRENVQYLNLQLAALGQPVYKDDENSEIKLCNPEFQSLTDDLVKSFREKNRLLSKHYAPADARIQSFIDAYLEDVKIDKSIKLPNDTLVLRKKGHARELSLPANGNSFQTDLVTSTRTPEG